MTATTTTTTTNEQSQVRVSEQTGSTVSTEIDKVVIGSVAAFTGVVGLWSVACLMSAMYQAGGPFSLAAGYFKALAGM